jgi:GrpB-like predicted nucleotidyltransferase (UPF0157 family)
MLSGGFMAAIRVLDHDPRWAALFNLHKGEIESLLSGLVAEVHHIGSTAVAGLAAKPKLDMDAVVRSRGDVGPALERLRQAGFVFHGDPYGDERWTFTRDGHEGYGIRLYVCAPGNRAHEERVMFRDWLRAHPEDAVAYAALKLRLAAEAGGDWDRYTGGKTAFVRAVLAKAQGFPPPCGEGRRMIGTT